MKDKTGAEQRQAPEASAPDPSVASGGDVEMMKAYGVRHKPGGRKVYGGGGILNYTDTDGSNVRMIPGQVRKVPRQVIARFNRQGCPPVFVPPGSQVEGQPVKEDRK